MSQLIYQIDAFTDRPFAGNPAAVCVLPQPCEAVWMQHVAREMNLSETAFLVPNGDGFDLRWFTPALFFVFTSSVAGAGRARGVFFRTCANGLRA